MRNRNSNLYRIAGAVVMGLVAINAVSQARASEFSRPRLVLSIVVDQLRTDYVEYLQHLMGEGGFRRLMDKGVYMRDVEFGASGLDAVSGTSIIYTGAYPNVSGVTGASRYDVESLRNVPTLYSQSSGFSPENLILSTVSDEIAIDGAGLGMIMSIACDPQQAIIMSGHAGTGAVRLDSERGNWTSIPYYGNNQQLSMILSRRPALSSRIDTMQWKPLLVNLNDYPGIPAQKRQYPFRHTFPSRSRDVYEMFATSARANEEITTIAIDCLKSMSMGQRDAIDMLNLAYTAAPFKYVKDGDYRLELEDSYLRLDRQLERLFKAVEQYVGWDYTVIMLSSTGYYNDATPVDSKYRIPSGDFSTKRAVSLLNSFYSASYGNDSYVTSYENGRFHLNHKLLQQKGVPVSEAAEQGKDFLQKMRGIARAYTAEEITGSVLPSLQSLQRITDPRNSGDIIIEVTPGWNLIDDTRIPAQVTPIRLSATDTPAFIFAPGLTSTIINTPVEASSLAATLSRILRIRSPNGSSSKALKLDTVK